MFHNLGLKVLHICCYSSLCCWCVQAQNTSLASIGFDCYKTDFCLGTGCFSYSKPATTPVNSGLCVRMFLQQFSSTVFSGENLEWYTESEALKQTQIYTEWAWMDLSFLIYDRSFWDLAKWDMHISGCISVSTGLT